MNGTAKALSWFALISTATFVVCAIGRNLPAELLSFPLIALAVAQLLTLQHQNSSGAASNSPQPQSASPLGGADREEKLK
jgi:hypothetical protein